MNLFRLIVNPRDFGQSVENLFYLSFLIRDGKCALDFEDGEPLICASDTPALLLPPRVADIRPARRHYGAADGGRLRAGPAEAADGDGVRHGDVASTFAAHTRIYPWLTLPVQRAIEVFNITEPMIPQRAKSTMRIGGKWYG